MELNNEVMNTLAEILKSRFGFATQREIDLAVTEIVKKTGTRLERSGGNYFSLSKLIRGCRIIAGHKLRQPALLLNRKTTAAARLLKDPVNVVFHGLLGEG